MGCSIEKKNENVQLLFKIHNEQGNLLLTLDQSNIDHIDWEEQCFYIRESGVNKFKNLNLAWGEINFIFKDKTVASIDLIPLLRNDSHGHKPAKSYVMLCEKDGQIMIDNGQICLRKMDASPSHLLRNLELRDHLKKAGLVKPKIVIDYNH
jgi:hypothetical protein